MLDGTSRVLRHVKEQLLVFRNKDLYLIITQKLTFMKSGGFQVKSGRFQVKSTQNLIKSDVLTKLFSLGGAWRGL